MSSGFMIVFRLFSVLRYFRLNESYSIVQFLYCFVLNRWHSYPWHRIRDWVGGINLLFPFLCPQVQPHIYVWMWASAGTLITPQSLIHVTKLYTQETNYALRTVLNLIKNRIVTITANTHCIYKLLSRLKLFSTYAIIIIWTTGII